MKDGELDDLLRSAQAPARPDSYWEQFPAQIATRLPEQADPAHPVRVSTPSSLRIFGALSLGLGVACLAVGIFLTTRERKDAGGGQARLVAARKCYEEVAALFPNQIRAIIFDVGGPHLILAEKADVPGAPPMYLDVCTGNACEGVVTFSGQKIPFNGESCEVLADSRGQVMLVGEDHVWSEGGASGKVRMDARPLEERMAL